MKVALVYDHVNKIGGAERVLVTLHELFPHAPLYTAVYDPQGAPWAKKFDIVTSFMQKLPGAGRHHERYPGLPALAFELFDFKAFDIVISVTSAEAKGIITSPHTLHISYCLTPTRYLWSHYRTYFQNPLYRAISLPMVSGLRLWDVVAGSRPDKYIAISETVAARIRKYYRRVACVIYPPVNTDFFRPAKHSLKRDYFLVVSRLVKHKRLEIAIRAANELQLPFVIVGSGLEARKLKALAGKSVRFVDNLTDHELIEYYQNCRAFIVPQEEDFGIATVEALACGRPVIAYKSGGSCEIITDKTGKFFYPQTDKALIKVLKEFKYDRYSPIACWRRANKFSKTVFKKNIKNFISDEWEKFKQEQ